MSDCEYETDSDKEDAGQNGALHACMHCSPDVLAAERGFASMHACANCTAGVPVSHAPIYGICPHCGGMPTAPGDTTMAHCCCGGGAYYGAMDSNLVACAACGAGTVVPQPPVIAILAAPVESHDTGDTSEFERTIESEQTIQDHQQQYETISEFNESTNETMVNTSSTSNPELTNRPESSVPTQISESNTTCCSQCRKMYTQMSDWTMLNGCPGCNKTISQLTSLPGSVNATINSSPGGSSVPTQTSDSNTTCCSKCRNLYMQAQDWMMQHECPECNKTSSQLAASLSGMEEKTDNTINISHEDANKSHSEKTEKSEQEIPGYLVTLRSTNKSASKDDLSETAHAKPCVSHKLVTKKVDNANNELQKLQGKVGICEGTSVQLKQQKFGFGRICGNESESKQDHNDTCGMNSESDIKETDHTELPQSEVQAIFGKIIPPDTASEVPETEELLAALKQLDRVLEDAGPTSTGDVTGMNSEQVASPAKQGILDPSQLKTGELNETEEQHIWVLDANAAVSNNGQVGQLHMQPGEQGETPAVIPERGTTPTAIQSLTAASPSDSTSSKGKRTPSEIGNTHEFSQQPNLGPSAKKQTEGTCGFVASNVKQNLPQPPKRRMRALDRERRMTQNVRAPDIRSLLSAARQLKSSVKQPQPQSKTVPTTKTEIKETIAAIQVGATSVLPQDDTSSNEEHKLPKTQKHPGSQPEATPLAEKKVKELMTAAQIGSTSVLPLEGGTTKREHGCSETEKMSTVLGQANPELDKKTRQVKGTDADPTSQKIPQPSKRSRMLDCERHKMRYLWEPNINKPFSSAGQAIPSSEQPESQLAEVTAKSSTDTSLDGTQMTSSVAAAASLKQEHKPPVIPVSIKKLGQTTLGTVREKITITEKPPVTGSTEHEKFPELTATAEMLNGKKTKIEDHSTSGITGLLSHTGPMHSSFKRPQPKTPASMELGMKTMDMTPAMGKHGETSNVVGSTLVPIAVEKLKTAPVEEHPFHMKPAAIKHSEVTQATVSAVKYLQPTPATAHDWEPALAAAKRPKPAPATAQQPKLASATAEQPGLAPNTTKRLEPAPATAKQSEPAPTATKQPGQAPAVARKAKRALATAQQPGLASATTKEPEPAPSTRKRSKSAPAKEKHPKPATATANQPELAPSTAKQLEPVRAMAKQPEPALTTAKQLEPASAATKQSTPAMAKKPKPALATAQQPEPALTTTKEPEPAPSTKKRSKSAPAKEKQPKLATATANQPELAPSTAKQLEPVRAMAKQPEPALTTAEQPEPASTATKQSTPAMAKKPKPALATAQQPEPALTTTKEPEPAPSTKKRSKSAPAKEKQPKLATATANQPELAPSTAKQLEPVRAMTKQPEPALTTAKQSEPASAATKQSTPAMAKKPKPALATAQQP
ncbi:unnamed protein product, partial [Gongylonema pulchrum]|uniref:Protein kinase domain-containing protein n=1 Tax=Gongylonema pulchrum TaxID=637853 RepID=A0A183CYA5_9BILA